MLVNVICVSILGFAGVSGDKSRILTDLPPITNGNFDQFQGREVPQKRDSEYYRGAGPYTLGEFNEKPTKLQPSPGFHYGNNNPYEYEPYTDGYKQSWKTLRSEKYETETVDNPHSDNPDNKYIVKSTYKIREKLPFDDHTVGYDKNYEYPLSEISHQYDKNEKIVDDNNAQTDPFSHEPYQSPKLTGQLKKKPKQYHYDYEFPKQEQKSKDYEYQYDYPRQEHKKSKDYDYQFDYPNQEQKKPKEYHYEYKTQQQKKPKELSYHYKYPSDDYEYHKNVHVVDHYLNKVDPSEVGTLHVAPPKSYGYNDVDYGVSKVEKYSNDFGTGPSDNEHYHNYKINAPNYDYL